MEIDESTRKFNAIFAPGLVEESLAIAQENRRFAYYTSAETAMKVLQNEQLWFRNALVMNDYSEISYGLRLIQKTFSGPVGARFRESVNDIFEGTIEKVEKNLSDWESDWELETYIACISLHDQAEDKSGRLSMWRAYGDTAIVVKNTPMIAMTDLLGVYSVPVMYLSGEDYESRVDKITDAILMNRKYLKDLGQDTLVTYIHHMLFHTAIGTKHPGFAEEKEWRLYYRPNERLSSAMIPQTVVVSGVPQIVYALPLRNAPEKGLHGADIPSLLDRIIIGPTEHPYVSVRAFKAILEKLGVQDIDGKVVASDIPLRSK